MDTELIAQIVFLFPISTNEFNFVRLLTAINNLKSKIQN
jgi:hypothetical protein